MNKQSELRQLELIREIINKLDELKRGISEDKPIQDHVKLVLWVDGGLHGPNPGSPLYGSYAFGDVIETVEFGRNGSNNESEYLALIAGLDAVAKVYDPAIVGLTVKTDSDLARLQIMGEWRIKAEHLRPLCHRAQTLLSRFGSWEIKHEPREIVVQILGH